MFSKYMKSITMKRFLGHGRTLKTSQKQLMMGRILLETSHNILIKPSGKWVISISRFHCEYQIKGTSTQVTQEYIYKF